MPGILRSDTERVILIGGYAPTMFRAWPGQEPSAEYLAALSAAYQPLISATESWHWRQRARTLDTPAAPAAYLQGVGGIDRP